MPVRPVATLKRRRSLRGTFVNDMIYEIEEIFGRLNYHKIVIYLSTFLIYV